MGSLRRAMAKCGEDGTDIDLEALILEQETAAHEWHPSAFYQLLEQEGPGHALEVWEAAEDARDHRQQQRPKRDTQTAEQNARSVRRAFADTWQFIQGDRSAQELLTNLEAEAARAFGPEMGQKALAMMWMLAWDGMALQTKFGSPPAGEMLVDGLTPTQRKMAHQLARVIGLHSESRVINSGVDDGKVVALRPPRARRCGTSSCWVAPFSVAQVLVVK